MSEAVVPVKRSLGRRILRKLLYLLYVFVVVVVALEIFLHIYLGYSPSFYTGFGTQRANSTLHFPYGDIRFNNFAYPDDDFALEKKKPRIGFIGDSACFGVGAGWGYRMSDLLKARLPDYELMNFCVVASNGITKRSMEVILESVVQRFGLDEVVYLLNLNDILPDEGEPGQKESKLRSLKQYVDWLRGSSYLYTYVRFLITSWYARHGYGHLGYVSYELWPEKYGRIFRATAERINAFDEILKQRGIGFVVVLLPYEMQISRAAEDRYRELGIQWEGNAFIDLGPQKKLQKYLRGVRYVDAYHAFVDPTGARPDRTRERNGLGQYFVYNKGDRIDWNHPNREGHRLLADFLFESKALVPR